MPARRFLILTTLLLLPAAARPALAAAAPPKVFALDPAALASLREAALGGFDPPALRALRADADKALKIKPLSVTGKNFLPPGGDEHDYVSLAPYWWPDPAAPGGLPYIRRDGERNPEARELKDEKNFKTLVSAVRTLALAYYLSGRETYAAGAARLLRAWFLDPETRMKPSLEFGQGVRGVSAGRAAGLIETRGLTSVVDAAGLLAGSSAWSAADQKGLEDWCSRFLDWMLTSRKGRGEAAAKNNHGTYYDAQVASLALFTGRRGLAQEVLKAAGEKRVAAQVLPDGRQPLELARTKSFTYSVMNLAGLFELARLGGSAGVDLWNFRTKDGRCLRAALDYILPAALGERKWEGRQIEPPDHAALAPLLLEAAGRFGEPRYRAAAARLDPGAPESLRALLAPPGASAPDPAKAGRPAP